MSGRLQTAVVAQVAADAPGALAHIDAPRVGLTWSGSAGHLAREESHVLRPHVVFPGHTLRFSPGATRRQPRRADAGG